jgi:2-(1,2-epoxy-1,2-dihydrophenyl)acetyl-CoA isomerase
MTFFGAIARLIARSDTAFIAAINGPAVGVGLAWALTCEIAIASERAVIVPAFGRPACFPK